MYRLTWPARVLIDAGYDIDLHHHTAKLDTLRTRGPLGDRVIAVDTHADVIVFQRPLRQEVVEIIPVLQAQGTAVVVEVDDDFHALPPGHPARREVAPDRNPRRNKLWLRRACELADLVTVSTPALAERYGSHGRVQVLENCVPASYLDITQDQADGTFGWTGSTHTHVADLCATRGAVGLLIDDGWRFHVVGTGVGVARDLELGDRAFTTTSWVPIDRYPWEYARLQVALVPLASNRFNQAKSWLKGAEAAALGVPFVASATDEYQRLHGVGAGLVAWTPDDFHHWTRQLLTDHQFRTEEADRGRAWAAEWTYERRAWRWIEAWAQAVTNHRSRRAAA